MSPSHKIKKILKSADLPKDLSEDLKKELESHFYEKERDLRLSGVPEKEVEQKVEEDFGDEEIVGSYFNFVHKKSFYSFIKAMMQNKNKPSIFYTVVLFIFLILFFQTIILDMATALQLSADNVFDAFIVSEMNQFRMAALVLVFITSLTLVVRLYRGGEFSQKLVSVILSLIIFTEIGITYGFLHSLPNNDISDEELIQNPEAYDESHEADWVNFYNENDGYQFNLPQSYLAYRKDGTSDLVKYFYPYAKVGFKPEAGEIVAFGPAYADDQEMIDVQVFDTDNSPDKKENETWIEYYVRTQLSNIKYQIEPAKSELFFGNNPDLAIIPNVNKIHLSEPFKMRQDILIQEFSNRLYALLYDGKSSLHKEILGIGIGVHTPEGKIHLKTFEDPTCPFTIQIPDYWGTGYVAENGEHIDANECDALSFAAENQIVLITKTINNSDLKTYFASKGYEIKRMGETQWQGMPARRFLLAKSSEDNYIGFGYEEAGFVVELKPNSWLIFQYQPQDKQVEKILNTLVIK